MLSASRNDQRRKLCIPFSDELESATYRIFGISISNDKGKICQFFDFKDVQIVDSRYIYIFFFKKDGMAEVVPILRALNAMIIQYRNRFVRVQKSGPQVITRYCFKS